MKIGNLIQKTAVGAGCVGLFCYGGMMLSMSSDYFKQKIKERKSRHYKQGYDDAAKELNAEIEFLRKRNLELMDEAIKRAGAAE